MLKMFFVGALMLASSSAVLAREPGAYQRAIATGAAIIASRLNPVVATD
jgi:hypothetical protein